LHRPFLALLAGAANRDAPGLISGRRWRTLQQSEIRVKASSLFLLALMPNAAAQTAHPTLARVYHSERKYARAGEIDAAAKWLEPRVRNERRAKRQKEIYGGPPPI
jgi:hypothetical protein